MGDFHQYGLISTLHRLGRPDLRCLEAELEQLSAFRPIALILPATATDLASEACQGIFEELEPVKFIKEIVVSLGQAHGRSQFLEAREQISSLPYEVTIIWNGGPNIESLYSLLEQHDVAVGPDGKGRSAWLAYGYILAKGGFEVIALHDCDIVNYDRELLARLCYPIANRNLDYEFCKGYYSRVTDRMHGRVTRLYVTPLIRSMQRIIGHHPFLLYLDSFRYPLAGEFSMSTNLARINRVPGDWGLEVGTLAEVYRNCSMKRVCQSDLCETYEHKHQELSPYDPDKGLMKMSIDIGKVLFRTMASEGVSFSDGFFNTLIAAYLRSAQDAIKRHEDDSAINGLCFDRHAESMAVEAFTKAIAVAGETFMEDPLGTPQIPNWSRVISAFPDFPGRLVEAIAEDNA